MLFYVTAHRGRVDGVKDSSVDEDETGPNVFVEEDRLFFFVFFFEELLTLRVKDKTKTTSGCFCLVPVL